MTVEQLFRPTDKIDLEPIRNGLMNRDGYSAADADRIMGVYKTFLDMCADLQGEAVAPPRDADIAWHRHILLTKRYIDDCTTLFGGYLIHDPETYLTPEWNDAWERTQAYFAERGYDLPNDEESGDYNLQPVCCLMPDVVPIKQPLAA